MPVHHYNNVFARRDSP